MPRDEQLSPHFHLSEFLHSQTGVRLGLRNEPGLAELTNLRRLAQMLEVVRAALGSVPVLISSGFRSRDVNQAVGGADNSAHLFGRAADFTAPGFGRPLLICRRLIDAGVVFDQLIYEGSWVHYAIAPAGTAPRGDVLTAVFRKDQQTRYLKGLAA